MTRDIEFKKIMENQRWTLFFLNTVLALAFLIGKIIGNPYIIIGDLVLIAIVFPVFLRDLQKRIQRIESTSDTNPLQKELKAKLVRIAVAQYVVIVLYGAIYYLPELYAYISNAVLYVVSWNLRLKFTKKDL